METRGRRRKREKSYVVIENSMFEDSRISYKAKGILGYLLTKPDGWIVKIPDLINHGMDGEKSLRAGLKELKTYGYLTYYRTKNGKGEFNGIIWEYDDVPFEPDSDENPHADFRQVDETQENSPHAYYRHDDKRHAENRHAENRHDENGTCISNTKLELTTDFTNDLLVSLVSAADINSIDSILKSVFAELPYDEIKAQLLKDALAGEVEMATKKQYEGLITSRLKRYRPKRTQSAQKFTKQPKRTELLPDWFYKEDEPNQPSEPAPEIDLEVRKREIEEMLKAIDEK